MDLSAIDYGANQTAELELLHPVSNAPLIDADTNTPVSITVIGIDSDNYKATADVLQNKRLAKLKNNKGFKITVSEMESDTIELLSSCITGWKNIAIVPGEALQFNTVNAKKLLLSVKWIKEQLQAFVEERSNFLKTK